MYNTINEVIKVHKWTLNLYLLLFYKKKICSYFERETYFLESSLWKTETRDKCIEVPLYAIKGKQFEKEFEIESFKKLDEGAIDFANLILPNKAFAEAFIKYLKEHRP